MTIIGFLTSVPLMIYKEGHLLSEFADIFQNNKAVFENTVLSGLTFCNSTIVESFLQYNIFGLLLFE